MVVAFRFCRRNRTAKNPPRGVQGTGYYHLVFFRATTAQKLRARKNGGPEIESMLFFWTFFEISAAGERKTAKAIYDDDCRNGWFVTIDNDT